MFRMHQVREALFPTGIALCCMAVISAMASADFVPGSTNAVWLLTGCIVCLSLVLLVAVVLIICEFIESRRPVQESFLHD